MKKNEDFDELNWAVEYRAIRDQLRIMAGIVGIISFCISFGMGLSVFTNDYDDNKTGDLIIMFTALVVFIIAVLSFRRPKPIFIIINGCTILLLIFVFSTMYYSYELKPTSTNETISLVTVSLLTTAVSIPVIGVITFMYSKLSKIPKEQTILDKVEWIDRILAEIKKANAKKDSDIIAFKVEGASWRVKLIENLGFFVKNGKHVFLSKKEDVEFVPQKEIRPGKKVQASFCFGNLELKGTIRAEFFQRYHEWKLSTHTNEESTT